MNQNNSGPALTALEQHLLQTLSFYEPMSLEKIILDFDAEMLENNPQFDYQQLTEILKLFEKRELVKLCNNGKEKMWLRVMPPRKKWWSKLLRLFF